MTQHLTVIGGGPGGYTAAFAAARAGLVVTLVESAHLGGTCLNEGCIPTKTLKASTDALDLALRLAEFGVHCGEVTADIAAMTARKDKVRDILRGGLEKTCAKLKITLLRGHARLLSPTSTEVRLADGSIQQVTHDLCILATGSKVLELPGLPFDGERILSSDHALELKCVPQKLVILGGGVIGCEMAFIYRALGSQVTLAEGQDRLLPLPSVDAEVSKLIQREMKKRGISCELGRTLSKVTAHTTGITGELGPSPFIPAPTAAQSKITPVEADAVLVTVGRIPHTQNLGLAEAGVHTDPRGWIVADQHMRTNVPGIYAIGDVLGPKHVMLAHVAAAEGLAALRHALHHDTTPCPPMEYSAVPSAIFTSPEVGCVGLSEEQAREQGLAVHCPVLQCRELGKAQAMNELPGFFKLVLEQGSNKILGAHLAGAHASDLIAELTLALRMGATAHDIAATIHAHPTLAEGVYEAALLGLE